MIVNRNDYKYYLGLMESGGNYEATNESSGALGKYQFTTGTLNGLRNIFQLPDWNPESVFLNDPDLQELYENSLITDSLNYIESHSLSKYIGMPVTGSKRFKDITTPLNIYGLLAGIHLAGSGNVKLYLENNFDPIYDFDDGFTSISDYMAYFSNILKSNWKPDITLIAGLFLLVAFTFIK